MDEFTIEIDDEYTKTINSHCMSNHCIQFIIYPPMKTVDSIINMRCKFDVSGVSEDDLKLLELNYMPLNNSIESSSLSLNGYDSINKKPSEMILYKKHFANLSENMKIEREGNIITITERLLSTIFDNEHQCLTNVCKLDVMLDLHRNLFSRIFTNKLDGSVNILEAQLIVNFMKPKKIPSILYVPFHQDFLFANKHRCNNKSYLIAIPDRVFVYTKPPTQIKSFSFTIDGYCKDILKGMTSDALWELSTQNDSSQTYDSWCKEGSVLCFKPCPLKARKVGCVMTTYDIELDCDSESEKEIKVVVVCETAANMAIHSNLGSVSVRIGE